MPVGGLDVSETSTKLRGQSAYATARGIGRMRGLKAYGKTAIAAQTGVGGVGYTQLPDGKYVLESDLLGLKRQWPEGYDILTKQGFDAYNEAIAKAQDQSVAYSDIQAKFEALSPAQKTPMALVRRGPRRELPKPFTQVFSARTKDAIPSTPGFYTVTKTTTTERGGTPGPGPKKVMLGTWSKGITTTSLYARLDDGKLILMGKSSVPWSKSWEAGGGTGITHEQRLAASKLAPELAAKEGRDYTVLSSKEKRGLYQSALGLVSASGYVDKDAIIKIDPKTGQAVSPVAKEGVWASYTPEVASALKKLKAFQKADGTYDWAGIITKGSTQEVVAAGLTFGIEIPALKGVKQSIDAYPELGKALSERGWGGYQAQAEKIKREWEAELKRDSPDLYKTYKKEGVIGLEESIDAANAEYGAFQARVKSGELRLLPDGQYIEKADLDKVPEGTRQILMSEGFKGLEALLEPDWENRATGEIITQTQFQQLVNDFETTKSRLVKEGKSTLSPEWQALGTHPTNIWTLTPESGQRKVIQLVSFIAPAARVGLKEYTIKDIAAIEWGLTAVNTILLASAFAPGAILGSLAGRVAVSGVSTAGAGMIGYMTARDWADLTPAQRAIGVGSTILYSLPMLSTVVRGVKITPSKPIPTADGVAPTWKGLTIANNPIIGRSGGRWVIGARNIALPEAKLILSGYHPEMMLETKVFVNPKALAKAGFTETQTNYLIDTLKARNLFAGKKSIFVSSKVLLEPTKYIDIDEMAVFLRQIQKYNAKIKQVNMLYGGTTIKAQLAPKLRAWRQLHDLDMQTTFDVAGGQRFVNETLALLKRLPGKRQYRISPKSPIRIEKFVDGKWEHMNDLKSEFIDPSLQISDIAGSKLDATGAYSYGRMVAEPTITVKVPGVGKFDIMALSEAGVRKGDTILRVRQTPEGTAFRPPQRGIARPGVPKDAADYYVILRTFEQSMVLKAGTADEWLASWARAMGYTKADMPTMLPKLRDAAIRVVGESPSNIIGYRFTPSGTTSVSPGASPSIMIHVPSSLGASVSGSLSSRISKPVSIYSLSPKVRASASAAIYTLLSRLKGGIAPSAALSAISPKIKPSPKASPSLSPLPSPSPSPMLKASPVPSPAPKAGVSPGLVSVPPTGPPTSPPPPTPPSPPPPGVPVSGISRAKSERERYKGAVAWQQGALKVKGKLQPVWKVWKYPYRQADLETLFQKDLPPGVQTVQGIKSARDTVQQYMGKVAPRETQQADIGAFIATVKSPTPKPGGKGEIAFKRDVPTSKIRGEKPDAWKKLPLHTTLEQLIVIAIRDPGAATSEAGIEVLEVLGMDEPAKAKLSAKAKFAKSRLAEKMEKASHSEIVSTINKMGLTSAETKELLKLLPDRERQQIRLILSSPGVYAPTRGTPKAEYLPTKLRRKKTKPKKPAKPEPMLVGARL